MLISRLSTELQSFLNTMSMGMRPRSSVTSLAIAKVLSDTSPLPTSPVDNVDTYYRSMVAIGNSSKLSKINELMVVDVEVILECLAKLYKTRYYCVYPTRKVLCLSPESVVTDFFGLSYAMSPIMLEAIKLNPIELTNTYNGMVRLFEELAV